MNDLSTAQLRRLLVIQAQIEKLQSEKRKIMGGQTKPESKRKISEKARKKLSRLGRARWKKAKAEGKNKL